MFKTSPFLAVAIMGTVAVTFDYRVYDVRVEAPSAQCLRDDGDEVTEPVRH